MLFLSFNAFPTYRGSIDNTRSLFWLRILLIWLSALLLVSSPVAANLTLEPTAHDFGTLETGQSSTEQNFNLENGGQGAVSLGVIDELANVTTTIDDLGNVSAVHSQEFKVTTDNCSNTELASGSSNPCNFSVIFEPTSVGSKQLNLPLSYIDEFGNPTSLSLPLTGLAIAAGIPDISAESASFDFGAINLGTTSPSQLLKINNIGNAPLEIGQTAHVSSEFNSVDRACTNTTLQAGGSCIIKAAFKPTSEGAKSDTISIPSNDPDTPTLDLALSGTGAAWCGGNYTHHLNAYPNPLDFGVEPVGGNYTLYYGVYSWTQGCDALEINNITTTGADAAEFSINGMQCYHGRWRDNSYSSCWFRVSFTPTAVGTKDAAFSIAYSAPGVDPGTVPLQAAAVNSGEPAIALVPSALDFAEVKLGFGNGQSKSVTLSNSGNVNLRLRHGSFSLSGDSASDFHAQSWGCTWRALHPGQSCQAGVRFTPASTGDKTAKLLVAAPNTLVAGELPLTGKVVAPANCADASVTIQSSTGGGKWSDTSTWQDTAGAPAGRIPDVNDVVRINTGALVDVSAAGVKTLCVQQGATLQSVDVNGTPIEIQASDYIENHGSILGTAGSAELTDSPCTQSALGTAQCAYPGADVMLKCGANVKSHGKAGDTWWYAYNSGCPILNTGLIQGGDGGTGSAYGADGGNAIVLARNLTNKGTIAAGRGGSIYGTLAGQAGRGGVTQLWGKLGGSGHLYNTNGAKAIAGDGGNCNAAATAAQNGGPGGNLWLVSLPNVHLSGGIHKAGKGGTHCTPLGSNGSDGWVRIEPNVIDLSGAQTRIEGGNVEIFGGGDWNLDLSGASEALFNVPGDIVLSVGDGGAIDLSGAANGVLTAGGTVRIFADTILLDEGRQLSDVIEATEIIVAPAKVLYAASLSGPQAMSGEPGETLTVNLTLSNNGATEDSYTLTVVNSAGWTLGQIPGQAPDTVDVPALSSVDIAVEVTLPAAHDQNASLSVSALSAGDTEVNSSVSVQLSTNPSNDVPGMALCPETGAVSGACNNRGQMLRNATLAADAEVQGGTLSGTVSSQGMVNNDVTILADTLLSGGVLSGNVRNFGTLADFELRDGSISGGLLSGNVTAAGTRSLFRDVQLLANAILSGGILQGDVSGDATAPAKLTNLSITDGAKLANLIIAEDVTLPDDIEFGSGVRFLNKALIPAGFDLSKLLPKFATHELLGTTALEYPERMDFTVKVLEGDSSVLDAINAIPLLKDSDILLTQETEAGFFEISFAGLQISLQPTSLGVTAQSGGVENLGRQSFRLNTLDGLTVDVHPVLQQPKKLQQLLAGASLGLKVLDDGNLQVGHSATPGLWFSVRPDWLSGPIGPAGASEPGLLWLIADGDGQTGLQVRLSPLGTLALALVFNDTAGNLREQYIYPALATPSALTTAAESVQVEPHGLVRFRLNGQDYAGVADYTVDGTARGLGNGSLSVESGTDLNADGLADFTLVYPSGERQNLFALPTITP
ncbi:choice-of-anchor D domain-containing protein [Candidatus Venteria ishoeyi]|uniref:Abnormal spindle-like microcephaly-associated protein ASH domain-containing protein n=1 Tax=Candidatus Venteria ishoeyi TaxID=1899563 RepID=A0A1H6FFU2_9GAMM|nr:choice-of-anchor D domain-containing protein [Candidatus Venteria ishoeyi]SEH08940.1 Uncharacterised protein [Candidatus Venteria ishoeyi]